MAERGADIYFVIAAAFMAAFYIYGQF